MIPRGTITILCKIRLRYFFPLKSGIFFASTNQAHWRPSGALRLGTPKRLVCCGTPPAGRYFFLFCFAKPWTLSRGVFSLRRISSLPKRCLLSEIHTSFGTNPPKRAPRTECLEISDFLHDIFILA